MSTPGAPASHQSDSASLDRADALSFLRGLAEEVSKGTVDLPCFPRVVPRISAALADPRTTAEQVVGIVGTEPRLAARLLQVANSAAYSPADARPLTDLRSAITRIGQHVVQSIALSYAMQQLESEASLAPIATQLARLWDESIAVGTLAQLVAERTKVHTDMAFLTGLVHGIGTLYILVRVATRATPLRNIDGWMGMMSGWEAPIGKAVLESWGFAEEMCEAVGDQHDYERKWKHDAGLTDVLMASIVLAESLGSPEPRTISMEGVNAFASIGLKATDCEATLVRAERRIERTRELLK